MGVSLKKFYSVGVPASNRILNFCPASVYRPSDISTPITFKEHPILLKLGAFYKNLLKMHPI